MYTLRTKDGYPAKKKDGSPFLYSTYVLARIGKRVLDADRKENYSIVAAE